MKIMATCLHCEREFLLDQLIEGPVITGKCPWCGELLAPNYTVLLPEVIRRAERGGSELESALKMLTGSWVRFRINPESVLEPIREELGTIEEEAKARGDLREDLRKTAAWAEHQSPESIEEAWGANARIGTLERELRDVAAVSQERDRNAAREVEAASDALAASAGGESGASASTLLRDDVARLSQTEGADPKTRARLAAAADDLAEAGKAIQSATPDPDRLRDALEHLRAALQEAEDALGDLAA